MTPKERARTLRYLPVEDQRATVRRMPLQERKAIPSLVRGSLTDDTLVDRVETLVQVSAKVQVDYVAAMPKEVALTACVHVCIV